MAEPKLLAQITVPTGGYDFAIEQTEFLTDGDMEAADTSAWTASRSTPLPTLTKETGTPHGGTRCLRVTTGAGDNGTALQDAGLGTGSDRTITGYARSDGTAVPAVYQTGYGYVWTGTTSTSWQSISATWTSGGDTIEFLNNSANQYVEFDDLSIVDVTGTTATITAGDYDSILELCAELETQLQTIDATFAVAVSSSGIVTISRDTDWDVDWASTDAALETLLGFAGTESVALVSGSYVLTATYRHRYGFYSPVGADYDLDPRRIPVREQETEIGYLSQFASTTTHRSRKVGFHLLSPEATSEGGSASDGYGSTVTWDDVTLFDFWEYTKDRPFRFYADRADGTVATPGTEGTDFVTCRRMGDEWRPAKVDQSDWAYWHVDLPLKVTGE